MKSLISLVLSAFMLFSTAPAFAHEHHSSHEGYECPMHPEVTGHHGDACPKCGMDLEAVNNDYHCPMHPEVTGTQGDTCPKCGMDLEATTGYHCPMHPEVTGEKGDTCPKCGMDLEPVAQGSHGHHMKHHNHH